MRRACADIPKTAAFLVGAAVFVWLGFHADAAQAAWTREQGSWFTAQTLTTYYTDRFVGTNGIRRPQPNFRKQEWNSYAEYGWRDDTTLGMSLFTHRVEAGRLRYNPILTRIERDSEKNYGLADSEFFLRQKLWQGNIYGLDAHVSLQPLVKLPSAYLDAGAPRSGTDSFDVEMRLQSGISFPLYDRHHFLAADIAYRKRGGAWRNQIKADVSLGMTLTDRVMLLSQFHLTERPNGTANPATSSATVNDYDLWKAQASLVLRLTDSTRVQFGGYKHIYARNTGDGEGLIFSVWREF